MITPLHKFYNKSYLAPLGDKHSTKQLGFLILNCPFTVIINNYKASLSDLDSLRTLVKKNNGFVYQPNKNIKIRAFKGLSTVLTSGVLNGLVIFVFFKDLPKALKFLNNLKNGNLHSLSYFSVLLNGHLANSIIMKPRFEEFNPSFLLNFPIFNFNRFLIQTLISPSVNPIYNIYLILNAYSKSINKRP